MKKNFYPIFAMLLAAFIIGCGGDDEKSNPENNQQSTASSSSDGSPGEGYVKVNCQICNGSGNCWLCFGSGKYCDDCLGSGNCVKCSGNSTCTYCKGDSHHICDSCNGTNKCPRCGGTHKCSQCGGLGQIDYGISSPYWLECGLCRGYGNCHECHAGECSKCDENGIWTCANCNGSGKCSTCTGSGLCQRCGGDPHCYRCRDANGKCNSCDGRGYVWEYHPEYFEADDDNSSESGSGDSSSGDTRKKCKYCNGSKKCYNYFYTPANKYYCRGSGECKWCLGVGMVNGFGILDTPCANCDTPGKVVSNGSDIPGDGYCSYCHGTGICSHCDGTGYE